jgi:hypothetical protein
VSILPLGEPCFCPPAWYGVGPGPYCPVHNPGHAWTWSGTTVWPQPQRLSDEDIERIADRVAEKVGKRRRKVKRKKVAARHPTLVAEMTDATGTKIITDA